MTASTTPGTTAAPLLGIDWGTSNRRAYLLDERGELVRKHEDDAGILNVQGRFGDSLRDLLQTLQVGSADIILSGMVGSRNGWVEAPYLDISQPITELKNHLLEVDSGLPGVRCRIVPGYRYLDPQGLPDVMRGEEAQVLGALALSASSGWFLLPGTHSKWVHVEDGTVRALLTFMTGELFALMSQHGTLSKVITAEQSIPAAFEAGLRAAPHGAFTHMAFCCRALVVTDMMPPDHTASYLSGLLIGSELDDIRRRSGGDFNVPVQVVGSPGLSARYLNALELLGTPARAWQPDGVYVAALRHLFQLER
ncbi:2-dehydro-3-deoxygalactonokinase [Noviherbaspirillum galbum]|uniref:2-dehydro-3-deoxygalactonokinase n=1 Tax=Noviherbaspirillum galbum TaxID=2709383 RepID=A0A6B3SFU9_9BURK|nr:2-dehydro-3-deoxygalactonokinase [Noviherbaspirillum galbum]NEX59734.1 2-dehydro-3-deoxygalactonokinase [Noviherbaspirillum galbum]